MSKTLDAVIKLFTEREQKGIEIYGETLDTAQGNWYTMLVEELADAIMYLIKSISTFEEEMAILTTKYNAKDAELQEVKAQLHEKEAMLDSHQFSAYKAEIAELSKRNHELLASVQYLTDELKAARSNLYNARRDNAKLEAESKEVNDRNLELIAEVKKYAEVLEWLRTSPFFKNSLPTDSTDATQPGT